MAENQSVESIFPCTRLSYGEGERKYWENLDERDEITWYGGRPAWNLSIPDYRCLAPIPMVIVSKIGKIILVIFVFLIFQNLWHPSILAVSLALSEGDEVRLSEQDNGKEVTVKVGDVIQIELKRFGSTGYEWHFAKPYGEYFELIREDTKEISREGFVGTPVIRTWELKALKKGETEVILYLYRSWEGRDKAVDRFELKVNIL